MVFQHNSRELDFGSLGFGENRELYFTLRNNNPVNVSTDTLQHRNCSRCYFPTFVIGSRGSRGEGVRVLT